MNGIKVDIFLRILKFYKELTFKYLQPYLGSY